MMPTEEIALSLRFGEHQGGHAPPDVDAFRRTPGSSAPASDPRRMSVLPGGAAQRRDAPLLLFFQHARYGIPAPGQGDGRPDPSSWSLRPTVFGYLAAVPPPRRGPSRARAWVIAACLPLPLSLSLSAEAAPKERPAVQRPTSESSVPAAPKKGEGDDDGDDETPSAAATGSAPTPDAEPDPEFEPPELPEPDDEATDLVASPPSPSAPDFDAALSDQATLDAAWEGVDGFQVELELKGGRRMRGHVGAVQRDTFTLIQAETGAVLVLPKSGVVSLRAYIPPPIPTKNGTGLLVGGGLFTGTGAPVFVAGVSILGLCPSCTSVHLPLLLVGGAALGAGIPMIVRGIRRRQEYQNAVNERALSPVVMRTRHGWTGGLRLRF